MKHLITAFLILINYSAYSQTTYDNINQKVDSFVISKMNELNITSLAIAVIKDGKIIYKSVNGFGNLEWKKKITEHSNFQIASCTKLLTSTLLLKTIYDKKIDLENYISAYIDSLPDEWKKIKIKHLISHSSGISEGKGLNKETPLTIEGAISQFKTNPLAYEPGTRYVYSQAEYIVLAYIFEKIYDKPFWQIIKDEVTTPMNMIDGDYDMEKEVRSPLGGGKYMQSELINEKVDTYYNDHGTMVKYKFYYGVNAYPAGAYFASINDFANWAVGLDKSVLFPIEFSNDFIYTPDKVGNNDSPFSKVGWIIEKEDGILRAGHPGGPGLGDVLRFPKEKITIITLSNDGELLPGMSRAIASWYVSGLSPKYKIEKFDR